MAFSEENKIKICKVLGITPMDLSSHLVWLGTNLTAAIETSVVAELTRWDAGAGSEFVSVEPKEKNFGARIDPMIEKNDIRRNIAALLELSDFLNSAAGDSFSIERG